MKVAHLCFSTYLFLYSELQLLWGKELKINTVHVSDVCRAIWHLTQNGPSGEVYNVVDKANTGDCAKCLDPTKFEHLFL